MILIGIIIYFDWFDRPQQVFQPGHLCLARQNTAHSIFRNSTTSIDQTKVLGMFVAPSLRICEE